MRKLLLAGVALACSLPVTAQSPLTTNFAGTTSLGSPAVFFFDLTVNVPLQFTQIDIDTTAAAATAGSIDVYTIPNTYVGSDTNPAAWAQVVAAAPLVSAGPNVPTPVVLTPFTLAAGTYGIAIVYNGIGPYYGCCTTTTYSNNELTLVSGGSASGVFGTAICCTPRDWCGSIHYVPAGPGTVATKTNYGRGCPAPSAPAIYEVFPSTTFDLSNMSLLFVPTGGGGYSILPGPNQWYSGFTNNLALGDDQCATVTLPFPFTHASGTTTTVSVSSNGFVWLGSNTNSACCTGVSATFLSDPMARIAPCWMDLYPPGGGGVFADFDANTGEYVVTWNQVPEYSTNPPVTMQVALQASGVFEIRYQTMTNATHQALAGYSVGGVTLDPGNSNLSSVTTAPLSMGAYATPMTLNASARPVLGTSTNLNTGAIVAGSLVGINSLGFGQLNPGVDLTPFGAPACSLYLNAGYNAIFVVSGATNSMPLGIPVTPSLAGIHVFAQSVVFAPGVNALGLITSNGVNLGLGNL